MSCAWYYPDRSRTDRLSIRIGYIPSCCQNYHYPDNISIPHLPCNVIERRSTSSYVKNRSNTDLLLIDLRTYSNLLHCGF